MPFCAVPLPPNPPVARWRHVKHVPRALQPPTRKLSGLLPEADQRLEAREVNANAFGLGAVSLTGRWQYDEGWATWRSSQTLEGGGAPRPCLGGGSTTGPGASRGAGQSGVPGDAPDCRSSWSAGAEWGVSCADCHTCLRKPSECHGAGIYAKDPAFHRGLAARKHQPPELPTGWRPPWPLAIIAPPELSTASPGSPPRRASCAGIEANT